MTHIEFRTNIEDKINYVCRWVKKALSMKERYQIVLFAQDDAQARQLDEALWSFSDTDFFPHVFANEESTFKTSIVIATPNMPTPKHSDILVNLAEEIPPYFAQFNRLIELVSKEETDKQKGRLRFTYYRDRGYKLQHEASQ